MCLRATHFGIHRSNGFCRPPPGWKTRRKKSSPLAQMQRTEASFLTLSAAIQQKSCECFSQPLRASVGTLRHGSRTRCVQTLSEIASRSRW